MFNFEEIPEIKQSLGGSWLNELEFRRWFLENKSAIHSAFEDYSYSNGADEILSDLLKSLGKVLKKTDIPNVVIQIYSLLYPTYISRGARGEIYIMMDWGIQYQRACWIKRVIEAACTGLEGSIYSDERKKSVNVKLYLAPWTSYRQ